jgi:multicomponent Na+:H+ antiporter subunit E
MASNHTDTRESARGEASGPASGATARVTLCRGAGFLALWVVLIGASPSDLAVGMLASAAATWTSLALLPSWPHRVRLTAVLLLIPRFLWKSLVAAWDVARRALDPRLPLRTGFVAYRARFRNPLARNAFASYTSLLPGTLPVEDDGETLLYHCLDIERPVAAELATEETALARAVGDDGADPMDRRGRR